MVEDTAALVKELREKTRAGIMDCKKALQEANGDSSRAQQLLRAKGIDPRLKSRDPPGPVLAVTLIN